VQPDAFSPHDRPECSAHFLARRAFNSDAGSFHGRTLNTLVVAKLHWRFELYDK
jgi:hypothetical protein